MNIRRWAWEQTGKYNYRLDSYYYYLRFMRMLESELFLVNAISACDGIALDIGANFGVWSYHLSKTFWSVEAFEPIAECCDVIRNTRRKNINVHNEALSSNEGSMELHIPVEGSRLLLQSARLDDVKGQFVSRTVPVKKLDDYDLRNVRFMKIDVEGHETDVLKGAENTIKRNKPTMIIEIEQRHLSFPMDNVFKLLASYGYRAGFLSGKKLLSYADFSYEVDQKPYLDKLHSVFYVHNFIFLHRSRDL